MLDVKKPDSLSLIHVLAVGVPLRIPGRLSVLKELYD